MAAAAVAAQRVLALLPLASQCGSRVLSARRQPLLLTTTCSSLPSPPIPHSEAALLRLAGAQKVTITGSEAGLNLGTRLLSDLVGPSAGDAETLRRGIQQSLEVRTEALQRKLQREKEGGGAADSDADAAAPAGANGNALSALGRGVGSLSGGRGGGGRGGGGRGGGGGKQTIELFVLDPSVTTAAAATAPAGAGAGAGAGAAAGADAAPVPLLSVTDSMCDVSPEVLEQLERLDAGGGTSVRVASATAAAGATAAAAAADAHSSGGKAAAAGSAAAGGSSNGSGGSESA